MRKNLLIAFLFFGSSFLNATDSQLILMRHGQAAHNLEKKYNANPTHPHYIPSDLTDEGKEQARATAKKLLEKGFCNDSIAVVYVSPLPRTLQTAKILVQAGVVSEDKIHQDPRLIEIQIGDLEGQPLVGEWKTSYVEKYHTESDEAMRLRVKDFYDSIAFTHTDGHVIVITHRLIAETLSSHICDNKEKLETGSAIVLPLNKK